MKRIIVAIDGFSANGKSTTAKEVARRLNYIYVDSGAMYRAVTYYFIQNNVDWKDKEALNKALQKVEVDFRVTEDGSSRTFLNNLDVEEQIRSMEVTQLVSKVSAIHEVREKVVAIQRTFGTEKGLVMDGRDIGSVVFPEAELKIFMTATPEVRAKRRLKELSKRGHESSLEEVLENIETRDELDTTRETSPLRQVPDAILLDNSSLSFDEQVQFVLNHAHDLIND